MIGGHVVKQLVTAAALALTVIGVSAQAETVISVTQQSYDPVGRPQCTAVRMNPATYGSLPADACTLGTAGADGPDRITKNTYDDAGQLKQVDQAYGTPIQRAYARYWYNPNGTKSNEADAKGNTSYLVYDGFDRLVTFYYPHPSSTGLSNGADYEAYGYDANGNKTSWRRRDGQWIFYTYDNLNREIVKDMPGGTSDDLYTGYDGLGHIVYKRFVSSSGSGVSYAYDGLGRVSSTTDMNGRAVAYYYNVDSTRQGLGYPDSQVQYYGYNNAGALVWTGLNGGAVAMTQSWDSLGRLLGSTRANPTGTGFTYDGGGRLASMTQDLEQIPIRLHHNLRRRTCSCILAV